MREGLLRDAPHKKPIIILLETAITTFLNSTKYNCSQTIFLTFNSNLDDHLAQNIEQIISTIDMEHLMIEFDNFTSQNQSKKQNR